MISSSIHMDYLRPDTWTKLGVILSILNPQKQLLHILMTGTGKYKGVTSEHKKVVMEDLISSGQPDIKKIFLKYQEIEEIRVYTLQGLESYYTKVQESDIYRMDIDEYLLYLYRLQEQADGIQIHTRTNRSRCYMEHLKVIIGPNKVMGAFLLWLTDQDMPYFNCILEHKGGKLVRLTTSDRYPDASDDYHEVCQRLKSEYPDSTQCVMMDIREFKGKIEDFYQKLG